MTTVPAEPAADDATVAEVEAAAAADDMAADDMAADDMAVDDTAVDDTATDDATEGGTRVDEPQPAEHS